MTSDLTNSKPKTPFELTALTDVWAIEKNDIDDRLSGNDPDSSLAKFGNASKGVEKKIGVDKWAQLAVLNFIPGGSQVALAIGALGAGVDLVNNLQVVEKANETERVLKLTSVPMDTLNWDLTDRLLKHIDAWLLPRLNSRISGLRDVLNASGGHQVVSDRIGLYETAIKELKAVSVALDNHARALKTSWDSAYSAHNIGADRAKKVYEESKRGINLSVDALLLSRTEAAEKLEEIEGNFQRLKCFQHGLLSRCGELAYEGERYCPKHLCFATDCSELVVDKSRYCKEHGNQMSNVIAILPKVEQKNGLQPKTENEHKKSSESDLVPVSKSKTFSTVVAVVLGIGFLLAIIVLANSRPEGREPRAPAPAPKASSVQSTDLKASLSTDDLASLTAAQLENRRLEIEYEGEQSAKKYAAYDEKINILTPRIKAGDRDQIVANVKEVMATMEARLVELRAQKDAIEKLMRIYQFIEASPSKLAPGFTLVTNTERLKKMTDGFQAFSKAVIDAENQNASSRSALAEVIATK